MSDNFTYYIDREQCMGDSLDFINLSFGNLDTAVTDISTTSHTWVTNTSSLILSSVNWINSNYNSLNYAANWITSNESSQRAIATWMQTNSSAVARAATWVQRTSSEKDKTSTWVLQNSGRVTQAVETQSHQVTKRHSIYPLLPLLDVGTHNINLLKSDYSAILGGFSNALSGDYTTLIGGKANAVNGDYNSLGGGTGNIINGNSNVIAGGTMHNASGVNITIGGGADNHVKGDSNTIAGGLRNNIIGTNSGVLGGINNKLVHNNTFAVGSNITSNAPNTAFVNNLNIANNPAVDNISSSFLVRAANGAVNVKVLNNLNVVDVLYTWARQNSANLNNIQSWVQYNSSSFIDATAIQTVSSNLANSIQDSYNSILSGTSVAWVRDNNEALQTLVDWYHTDFSNTRILTTWFTDNSSSLQSIVSNYDNNVTVRKFKQQISIVTPYQSFNIEHNLNTFDVNVECYNAGSGETVEISVKRTSLNDVLVEFGNISNGAFNIVIMG